MLSVILLFSKFRVIDPNQYGAWGSLGWREGDRCSYTAKVVATQPFLATLIYELPLSAKA